MLKRLSIHIITLLLVLLSAATIPAISGGIMSFSANGSAPALADTLKVLSVVREQVAVTTVTQVFHNTLSTPATPMYGTSLPSNAMVTNMRWKIKDTWYKATMSTADTSTSLNTSTTTPSNFNKWFSAAAFTFMIKDTILPAEIVTVELTYVELLQYKNGTVPYVYSPTLLQGVSGIMIDEWTVDIESGRPISNVVSAPVLSDTIERTGTSIRLRRRDVVSDGNVCIVSFKPEYDALTMNVLSTKPANEDGYALMLAVPKTEDDHSHVLPNRITFVIDRSGSMAGERIKNARDAAEQCVRALNPDDIFNIVAFDDRVLTWSTTHQPATPVNIEAATSYIRGVDALGGTDIMQALDYSLKHHKADNYVNVIIFMTDGEAFIDHDRLKLLNTGSTRVFVFGIGRGINPAALERIGKDHNGSTFLVEQESMIVPSVTTLFQSIKDPIIKNPRVTFSPDIVYDVYPQNIPDIYQGEQLLLVGRYKTPGDVMVTVEGINLNGRVSYPFAARLSDNPNINVFVGKIWAKYRISMLLEWMRNESSTSSKWKEWREEVIRLGKTFGIITPFTSLEDNNTQDGATSVTHDEIRVASNRCNVSPNPVRDRTTITIDLHDMQHDHARVEIVDIRGNIIAVLFDADMPPEVLSFEWNCTDLQSQQIASGVYQLVVTVDGVRSTTNINVLR